MDGPIISAITRAGRSRALRAPNAGARRRPRLLLSWRSSRQLLLSARRSSPGGVRRRRRASEGAARGRALLWRRRDCSGPAEKIPVFCVTVPGARHVTTLGHSTVLLLQGVKGGIPGGPLAVPACLPLALDVLVSEVEDHPAYGNRSGTARAADHRTLRRFEVSIFIRASFAR